MLKFSDYSKIPGIKINESVVKVDNIFKVTLTYDVPLTLVKDYIAKIKSETDKNPLEQFGAEHIAEQMMQYTLSQFMTIDNLPSSVIVGDSNATKEGDVNLEEEDNSEETPKEEPAATEPKEEEKPEAAPAAEAPAETPVEGLETKKEEEEEESNYMNTYTTMGQPVNTGFKISPINQKSPKNNKVGLHESLTDGDLK